MEQQASRTGRTTPADDQLASLTAGWPHPWDSTGPSRETQWPEHALAGREPQFRTRLPGPSAVTRAIADAASRALSTSHDVPAACLRPPVGGPAGDSGHAQRAGAALHARRAAHPPRPRRARSSLA
jgi:hypothetical protein